MILTSSWKQTTTTNYAPAEFQQFSATGSSPIILTRRVSPHYAFSTLMLVVIRVFMSSRIGFEALPGGRRRLLPHT